MDFKPINKIIVLTIITSFFMYSISWFIIKNNVLLQELFQNTSFSALSGLLIIVNTVFIQSLMYLSILFLVGSIISLLLVFLTDILMDKKRNKQKMFIK